MRSILLALLLVATLTAAPAPQPRPRQVIPGTWLLVFAGSVYTMELNANGAYTATNGSTVWTGSWAFGPESRMFLIHETCGGGSWSQFVVRMDEWTLSGQVVGSGVKVEIRSK